MKPYGAIPPLAGVFLSTVGMRSHEGNERCFRDKVKIQHDKSV
jgi:hypothetical protein